MAILVFSFSLASPQTIGGTLNRDNTVVLSLLLKNMNPSSGEFPVRLLKRITW